MGIEQKIEQMYKALEDMQLTEKLSSVKPEFKRTDGSVSVSFDFKKGADSATAANRASQLVANIACLKDHLRVWCAKNGKPFAGEALINSNREVAIVHDLWNLDKHAELSRPSRSGLSPKYLNPPRSTMVLKAEPGAPQPMFFIPISGGPIQTKAGASLRIVADVVDKDGNALGSLEDICEKAVAAWEAEFGKAGLIL
jgi:hypothetical protein